MIICDQKHKNWYEHIYSPHYINSPHNSKHLFDIYSLSHLFTFLLLGIITKNLFGNNIIVILLLVLSGIIFEIYENSEEQIIKYRDIEYNSSSSYSYSGDSKLNIFGDIISNIFGIYLAYNFPNNFNIIVSISLFVMLTSELGFNYWTDAFRFMLM